MESTCAECRCTPVHLPVTLSPVDLACQLSPGAQPPVRLLHGLGAHRTAVVVAPPAPHCVYALMPVIQAATGQALWQIAMRGQGRVVTTNLQLRLQALRC